MSQSSWGRRAQKPHGFHARDEHIYSWRSDGYYTHFALLRNDNIVFSINNSPKLGEIPRTELRGLDLGLGDGET
jgi:hypothetical protein